MTTFERDQVPRVAIITVSYGSAEVLRSFLSSLREHHGSEVRVAVVDNKPGAEGVGELAHAFDCEYVPLPENPGYGAGMNAGVEALTLAHGDFDAFFFCNPDVEFTEPVIDELASSLFLSEKTGSVGPLLLNDDGSTYPSARNIPSIGTGVGHALFSRAWSNNPWSRAYKNASEYSRRRVAGSLSGAAVMVKSSVLHQIGGWDEAYFMHFEDIDLGWRISQAGYQNVFEPTFAVQHSGAHSTKKHAVMVEQAMTKSAIRFMNKRYSGFWHAPLRLAISLGLRARGWFKVRSARRG